MPEIYIQSVEDKSILVVEIFPGSQKPYYLKKAGKQSGTYIRVGSTNRRASIESIEELERQRCKIPFDSLSLMELEAQAVDLTDFQKQYQNLTGKALGTSQLENLGLFARQRDQVFPTHAGLLLSDSPARKRYFPYAKIECARFKGTDQRVFLDQATIESPLHASIEPAIAFIKKNIALGATIGEIYREDRWEYPIEAIREALVNAVIHRDYALLGSDIKVAIYDDMLEITSPGPLPDTLPVEDLGTGRSEIRNRVLAPLFKDLKLIEAWGSGIRKMKRELADYPGLKLVLQEIGHAFQIQFIKERPDAIAQQPELQPELQPESLAQKVLEAMEKGPLSKAEISKKLGQKTISGPLNQVVRALLKNGLIEYTIPEKPNSRLQKYRLPNQAESSRK